MRRRRGGVRPEKPVNSGDIQRFLGFLGSRIVTGAEDLQVPGPLLRSKITPPGVPSWAVDRPRIGKRLVQGVRHGMLTVVSGPAGAGKTTALAAWVARGHWPGPVAWLTLDEYDNQPDSFWRYLSAALRRAGIALPAEQVTTRAPVTAVLEAQRPPAVLILDNLHLLRAPGIADELACMLRQARAGLRVIIAARGEPPLPLRQFLLSGDLTEIRADQLAFTVPEAKLLHGDLPAVVRYATRAGEWQLAARAVVDELAMDRLLDPGQGRDLVAGLGEVPSGASWRLPQPFLAAAGIALAAGDAGAGTTWLGRADHLLRRLSIDQEVPSRFAAAVIRFELARWAGDPDAMYSAAAQAGTALSRLPAQARARHPELDGQVLARQGSAELWLGHLDQASKALAQAGCTGGLALTEALNGRLGRAEELATRPGAERPEAASVPADLALAWARLERDDLPGARNSLKRAETGLRTRGDRAAAAVGALVAARLHLAEGRPEAAARMLDRAREGWPVPAWLEHRLTLAEARVRTLAGDTAAALAAADRCAAACPLGAAVARAAAWAGAGDLKSAGRALRRALESAAGDPGHILEPALLDALLLDARLGYASGDHPAARRSLARALRIACGENVRLPFAMEQGWLGPVLGTDAGLSGMFQALYRGDAGSRGHDDRDDPGDLVAGAFVEPLTGREHDVLARVAQLMSTAEIANELCISINTVKTHLKSVHRKLAVTHRREAVRRARQLKLL